MNYRTMLYYPEFRCIGGICEDSCCENWEIDLDEESVKQYKKQKGDFGKRLKDNMSVRDKQFILNGTRCPFLNSDNLCDIFIEMGKDCLCQTCTNFPRHIEEFENLKEVSLTISCPEACRIMLAIPDKITFVCKEGRDEEYGLKPIKPLSFFQKRKENKLNEPLFQVLVQVRKILIDILQNRELSIEDRASFIMAYMPAIQHFIDCREYGRMKEYMDKNAHIYKDGKLYVLRGEHQEKEVFLEEVCNTKRISRKKFMLQVLNMYEGLERIKPEWTKKLSVAMQQLQRMSEEDYKRASGEFRRYYKKQEYEFEHLLVYFIFNYFLGASYDGDAMTKVKFAVLSFMVIWELDFLTWLSNDKEFTFENQVENAHAYSKEVEHSYNNYESLQLILSAHPLLSVEQILC